MKKSGLLIGLLLISLCTGCSKTNVSEPVAVSIPTPKVQEEMSGEPEDTEELEDSSQPETERTVFVNSYSEKGTMEDSVFKDAELMEYSLQIPEIALYHPAAMEGVSNIIEQERYLFEDGKMCVYWDADDRYRLEWQEESDTYQGGDILYFYDVGYEVTQNDEAYISLLKHAESYTGGAHGSYIYTGIVLDAQTGETLALDDFLQEGEYEKAYLAEYLIEQLMPEAENYWENFDEIVAYSIYYQPTFYLQDNELIFVFNQYEIGSYAIGPQFAKIPLEVLKDLENVVQDKEKATSYAERMKLPESLNHYMAELPAGAARHADLDGDGVTEEMMVSFEEMEAFIQINGVEYTFFIEDSIREESIGIFDLNTEDGKFELAVWADGSSDDPVTVFFRYDGTSLYEIGRAYSMFDRTALNAGNVYLFGDGTVYGEIRTYYPLETRTVSAAWMLDAQTDTIVLQEKDYYAFESKDLWRYVEDRPYLLNDSIVLYQDCSRDSDYVVLEGEQITQFFGSDCKNWLQIEMLAEDKLYQGWIYVEDLEVETQRDVMTNAWDVIENLFAAG